MNRTNRRSFIRTGLAGAAGVVAFSPGYLAASEANGKNIITRKLGRTGLTVPVISYDTARSNNAALCKAASENGIVMFDAARGHKLTGDATKQGNLFRGIPRESMIIETRIKPAGSGLDGKPAWKTTSEDFMQKFNTCLAQLKMDYVDILLVDGICDPEMLEYKPVISALEKIKRQKKARFTGFSTHRNMVPVIGAAAGSDRWDVILTTYNFKLNNLTGMNAAIKKANRAGIGIVAMETIDGGRFLDKEKTIAVSAPAAMKWALSNTDVTTVISGITTLDHLEASLRVMSDIAMTEVEKNELLAALSTPGIYCSGCNGCLGQCPSDLPVPELMRAYMYAYGYSSIPMAYSLLGELGTGSSPCIKCETCRVECKSRFNIRERITDVSRLVNVPSDFIV